MFGLLTLVEFVFDCNFVWIYIVFRWCWVWWFVVLFGWMYDFASGFGLLDCGLRGSFGVGCLVGLFEYWLGVIEFVVDIIVLLCVSSLYITRLAVT